MDKDFKYCQFCDRITELKVNPKFLETKTDDILSCPNYNFHEKDGKQSWAWVRDGKMIAFNMKINKIQININYEKNQTTFTFFNKIIEHTAKQKKFNFIFPIPKSENDFNMKIKTALTFM